MNKRINREIRDNPGKYNNYDLTDLTRLNNNNPLIIHITKNTIKNIIKSFKNKAPGKSGINKQILMNLPEISYEIYALLGNRTLSMGYFPVVFKEGIIILILKPGKNPRLITSYRPIMLLEVPAKILEKIINDRFTYFQETNNNWHPN